MCWINIMNPYSKLMINKKIKLIKYHQINNLMINKNKLVKMIKKMMKQKNNLIKKTQINKLILYNNKLVKMINKEEIIYKTINMKI